MSEFGITFRNSNGDVINPKAMASGIPKLYIEQLERKLSAITAENEQLQAQVAMLREACIEMRSHEARPSVQRMADEAIRSTDGQEYVNRELDEQAKLLIGELNRADAAEAQVASLYDALGRITKKYFDAPDGPLGCGFTNHDFFHAEKVRLSTTQTAEAYKRRIQAQAWRPIETAPKDGTGILAFIPFRDGARVSIGSFEHGEFFIDFREWACVDPTHWMPLPPSPELKGE